jgi:hypothetical protein
MWRHANLLLFDKFRSQLFGRFNINPLPRMASNKMLPGLYPSDVTMPCFRRGCRGTQKK